MNRAVRQSRVFLILALLALALLAWFAGRKSGPGEMRENRIDAAMGNLDAAALSPNGVRVAILRTSERVAGDMGETFGHALEIRDVHSAQILASVTLPSTTVPRSQRQWWYVSNRVRYCDRGRYLLTNGDGGSFYAVDTATYSQRLLVRFELEDRAPAARDNGAAYVVVGSACAANAPVAAFELLFGPYGTGVTRIFDLETGWQTGEIREDISPGRLVDLEISPSGASAAILLERPPQDPPPGRNDDLVLLDLKAGAVSGRMLTGMDAVSAAFAGDDEIALAAGDAFHPSAKPKIGLYDIHTGAIRQEFGDAADGARASVGASADGRILLGYTGRENFCESCPPDKRGLLQIEDGRFTLWNRASGQAEAHSPKLPNVQTASEMLDLNPFSIKVSQRPRLELSESGNAVLAAWPGFNQPIEVYTRK